MRVLDEHGGILLAAGALGAGALLGAAVASARRSEPLGEGAAANVTPAEDLMREHGVLRRVLLIYDEVAGRLERGEPAPAPAEVIAGAAGIVRTFVEDYHGEMEEQYVFPHFEKAGVMVDLVRVLREQHAAGRRLTDAILRGPNVDALRASARMFRPHAAREDTILFPAMQEIMGAKEYAELGEVFEDQERARFGSRGFEELVAEVARLEDRLGIHDLAMFTPR